MRRAARARKLEVAAAATRATSAEPSEGGGRIRSAAVPPVPDAQVDKSINGPEIRIW
jgi:hypothetical protein